MTSAGGASKEGLVEEVTRLTNQRWRTAASDGLRECIGEHWIDAELGHLCSGTPLYRGVHQKRIF